MTKLNPSNYQTSELSIDEVKSVDGGVTDPWTAFAVAFVVLEVALNPKAHYEKLVEGFKQGASGW